MAASAALSRSGAAKRGLLMFTRLRPCSSSLVSIKSTSIPTLNFSNPVVPPVGIIPARDQEKEGIANNFNWSLLFLDKTGGVGRPDLTRLNVRGRYDEVIDEGDGEEDEDDSDFDDELDGGFIDEDEFEALVDDSDEEEKEEKE